MKKLLLLFLIIPIIAICATQEDVKQYAINNKVICREGVTSCTAALCGNGYYNENGEYIYPKPCNTCTTEWHCSDNKQFEVTGSGW